MRLAQRGGTVPESTQEVIGYHADEAGERIQRMIDKYAIHVVAIFTANNDTLNEHTIWVIYEEDNTDV